MFFPSIVRGTYWFDLGSYWAAISGKAIRIVFEHLRCKYVITGILSELRIASCNTHCGVLVDFRSGKHSDEIF